MSQNDMSIANASGATVRADINSALQALASSNSGPSAPGTTYATMPWFDETNNILKIRDEANSAWVNIASLVGTTWVPYSNGSVLGTLANQNAAAIGVDLVMSSKAIKGARATVASASNVNLDSAAGNAIDLTGTTTITAFTIADGAWYFVRYTGAGLTLTHNASTLICPTGANITLATGDSFLVYGRATNQVAILSFQRASGAALIGATTAADIAAMEAAASLTDFVSPGRTIYAPSAAKFYALCEMVGTHSVIVSMNLSSVTDLGIGQARVNFFTAFSSSNFAAESHSEDTSATTPFTYLTGINGSRATTRIDVYARQEATGPLDTQAYSLSGHGDL